MSWDLDPEEWLRDPPARPTRDEGVDALDEEVRLFLTRGDAPPPEAPSYETAAETTGEYDVPSESAEISGEFSAPVQDVRDRASASGSFSIPEVTGAVDPDTDPAAAGQQPIRKPAVVINEARGSPPDPETPPPPSEPEIPPAPEPEPPSLEPTEVPPPSIEPPDISPPDISPPEVEPPGAGTAPTGDEPLEITLRGSAGDPAEEDVATLFIPMLTRPTPVPELEDLHEDEALRDAEIGAPAHVDPAVTPPLDPEELEMADIVEESGAGPAPPRPPPERKRRKHWCDNVFSEHFVALRRSSARLSAQRDVDFLLACLDLEEGATVLDVGAGAGEHAFCLGAAGYRVVGVDNSIAQVLRANEARDGTEGDVDFMHGDMRDLPTDEAFDAVLCLGTSFGYFEEEQNRLALQHMRDRIKPGGKFAVQVFNRDHLVSRLPARSWWQGDRCLVLDEAEMNFFANRLRVHRTVVFEDGRQYEHYMFMRAFTLHDLGKLVTDVGLKVVQISGSRDTPGRFYGATSPDIWIVAQRPTQG